MLNTTIVIGGCGFIGNALVRRLLRESQDRIVVVDNLISGHRDLLPLDDRISVVVQNVAKFDLAPYGSVTRVFYLAAAPFIPDSFHNPDKVWKANVAVLESFTDQCRFTRWPMLIYASSGEVYGNVPFGAAEESSASQLHQSSSNPYALSRAEGERILALNAEKHGLNVFVMRLFTVIGPMATHPYFVPEMVRQLCRGQHVIRHGNLDTIRDFVSIVDVVDALVRASVTANHGFTAINVASSQGHTTAEVLHLLIDICGRRDVQLERDESRLRPRDIARLVGDNSKARSLLGWTPRVAIPQALTDVVSHYRATSRWPYERTSVH